MGTCMRVYSNTQACDHSRAILLELPQARRTKVPDGPERPSLATAEERCYLSILKLLYTHAFSGMVSLYYTYEYDMSVASRWLLNEIQHGTRDTGQRLDVSS